MDAKTLNRKQNYLIILCWLVYTSGYFGRYSYNANINSIITDFKLDPSVAYTLTGLVATSFFFSYGFGQIFHGILSSKYPKRYIFPLSLGASSVINLVVYFGAPFAAFKYLWLINGVFQSTLWSSLVLVMSENLDTAHLKRAVMVMGTTGCAGTFLVYGLASAFSSIGNYKLSFLVGPVVMLSVGALWLFTFHPVGAAEKSDIDYSSDEHKDGVKPFVIITVIAFCVFAVADNFVKDGMSTWVPSMIKGLYGMSDGVSLAITTVLNLIGMISAVVAVGANKLIKNLVSLASFLFGVCALLSASILFFMKISMWPVLAAFGLVMLLTHAINSVITSMGPLYMRKYMKSGKMSGIVNGCCYIGSTVSAYALGVFADKFGWNPVFLLFTSVCAGMAVFGVLMRLAVYHSEKIHK